jgi:hypothetical protein
MTTEGARTSAREHGADDRSVRTRTIAALATVAVCSLVGAAVMIAFSPHGVHTTPDSFTYLGAADSLAHGKGWTYPFGDVGSPVTLFPPLYPAILSVPELLGISVFGWVTWQNAFLLAVFSGVVGAGVATATGGSITASVLAVTVTYLGTPTAVTYARIWSESLFFPLVVGILVVLGRFLETWRTRWLLVAAVLTSLSMLTRYAGLSVFVTCCTILLVVRARPFLERARLIAIYVGIALAPSAVWIVRNRVRSGTLTGDNELIHDLSFADIAEGIRTIGAWLGGDATDARTRWTAAILAVSAVVIAVVVAVRSARRERAGEIAIPPVAAACAAFVVVHFAFIAVANAFSTRAPPFNDRILGPAFAPLVIAIAVTGQRLWVAFRPALLPRIAVVAAACALLGASFLTATDSLSNQYGAPANTEGAFREMSEALAAERVRGSVLFSNRPNIAWYVTGEPVAGLPRSCRGGRTLPNPDYRDDLRVLSERLDDEPRQVLIIGKSKECEPPYSLDGLMRTLRLERRIRVPKVIVLEGPAS